MAHTIPTPTNGAAPLFTPYKRGVLDLSHRLVYAPLTRCRAPDNIPLDIHVEYYTQRATKGGLLISEGTIISDRASGYPSVPGIWTQEQVEGWKPVTAAVHQLGSTFFCQLWHVGRASAPCYQPDGGLPLAPSVLPIPPEWEYFDTKLGKPQKYPLPRELAAEELPGIVEQYRVAARNAIAAGFDGVEIHAANGYLIHEFLSESSNHRTDAYGGPIENRARLALEIVRAVVEEVGAERTGIRFSPFNEFLGMHDAHPFALYTYLLEELAAWDLAYVHMVTPIVKGNVDHPEGEGSLEPFRAVWKGTFLVAGGFKRDSAVAAVREHHADLVTVGRHFLANPDLPRRWALDAPLNKYDRSTFYTPGVKGYLDYPFLEDTEEGKEFLANLKPEAN
uniref:NADH:flavin oxidoreductase/NADH oxidase N-terminal domain-containing protein n=2 Tax=Auxenochlorella protothecoides TaxID=3075 RepID=A0A1D1ZSV2_AUXPR